MKCMIHCTASLLALTFLCVGSHSIADSPVAATPVAKTAALKKGDAAGAFYVTKVAGAEGDGVAVGTELCYRCRYGSRPMVMVFTRSIDGNITKLTEQLDTAVAENKKSQFRALVTLLGEDGAKVKQDAAVLAAKSGVKNVPVVVAKKTASGPVNYRLSHSAEVTVVFAQDSQIVSVTTYKSDEINIAAIMDGVQSLVK